MNFDNTTTPPWTAQSGPIHLRHSERKPDYGRDFRAAHGIALAVMFGANLIVWGYVIARWTLG